MSERTRTILGKVGLTPRGAYVAGTTYDRLDIVSYNGTIYISKVALNTSLPTDSSKWIVQTDFSNIVTHQSTTVTITPEVLNRWGNVSQLDITLSPADEGKAVEYKLEFTVSSNNFTFTCTGIRWPDNEEPDWENGYTYQVSILNGLALYAEWEAEVV